MKTQIGCISLYKIYVFQVFMFSLLELLFSSSFYPYIFPLHR